MVNMIHDVLILNFKSLFSCKTQQKWDKWLTTAGDGTWMLATERGLMWLAKWQRTTPSINAAPMSSGKITFNLDSRFY